VTAGSTTKCIPTAVNNWATHPAFTFGTTELNGIWIGKFESSRSDSYYCYTYPCNGDGGTQYIGAPLVSSSLYATIKPNKAPATYQRVSNQYLSAKYIKTAHNLNTLDVNMSNNNHWGAATYLSTSIYGTNTTKVYNNGYYYSSGGSNSNTTSTFRTGCGPLSSSTEAGQGDSNGNVCSTYETTVGQYASTTGNVYGIYDMAGGVYEYQMAVYANPTGTPMTGYTSTFNSGFTVNGSTTGKCYLSGNYPNVQDCNNISSPVAFPDTKYYQTYDVSIFTNTYDNSSGGTIYGYDGNNNFCTYQTCGGQALHETKSVQSVSSSLQSWGLDYSRFVDADSPWFIRGGYSYNGSHAGLFSSLYAYGAAYRSVGWRAVAGAY
jgi:hypothetical protein